MCSDYNIAIYENCLSKVKFQGYEIKTNTNKATPEGLAEILLKGWRGMKYGCKKDWYKKASRS